jgi:hypothetical protein
VFERRVLVCFYREEGFELSCGMIATVDRRNNFSTKQENVETAVEGLTVQSQDATDAHDRCASVELPSVFYINPHDCDTSILLGRLFPSVPAADCARIIFSDRRIEDICGFEMVKKHQRINRIPHLSQLLLKKPLAEALGNANVGVETWRLPEDRELLRSMIEDHTEEFFIVKPNGLSGGSGISIHRGLSKVWERSDVVVQPVLERPLLYHGRKVMCWFSTTLVRSFARFCSKKVSCA